MRASVRYFLIACVVLLLPSASALAQDESSKKDDDFVTREWGLGHTTFERNTANYGIREVSDVLRSLEVNCRAVAPLNPAQCEPHPMTPAQRESVRKAGIAACERLLRECRVDLMITSVLEDSNINNRPMSPAELQLCAILNVRIMNEMLKPLREQMAAEWKRIATPEQLKATEYCLHSPNGGLINPKVYEAVLWRRMAGGEITEEDTRYWKIDFHGLRNPRDLPVPAVLPWEDYWQFIVAEFVDRHGLTPEQQASAKAILDDCLKHARQLRKHDDAEIKRLWKQLLTAYLAPKESKVPLKEAMRQYRRVSQEAVRPNYEEMQRRLEAILTTEQREKIGPPPPKPEWMRLMEIALSDDDEPPSAASQPTTQPTTRPTTQSAGGPTSRAATPPEP